MKKKTNAPSKKGIEQQSPRVRSVWDDLCDTPGDAGKMLLRSMLTIVLNDHIKAHRWSKPVAAKRCGVSVAVIDRVHRGSVTYLAADDLAAMIRTAGLDISVKPANYVAPRTRKPASTKTR
jgi:predicted XRE-type DNA-binding protein